MKCMRWMRKVKKTAVSLLLSVGMVLSLAAPSMAAEVGTVGSAGNTPVELTAEASVFDVTVPTRIAFHIDSSAHVTCPDDLSIVNRSAGPVEVTDIEVQTGDWTVTNYNNGDRSLLAAEKVGANKLGLAFTPNGGTQIGTTTDGTQSLSVDADEWLVPAADGVLSFDVDAITTAVDGGIADAVTAANVVFTIGWKVGCMFWDSEVSPVEWFTVTGDSVRGLSSVYDPDVCGTDIVIPGEVNGVKITEIYRGAFMGKSNLYIYYPTTKVGVSLNNSFYEACKKITSVVIPDGVQTIGMHAFEGCLSLEKIYIPVSVTKIESGAFSDMADNENGVAVYYGGSAEQWAMVVGNDYVPSYFTIYYNAA